MRVRIGKLDLSKMDVAVLNESNTDDDGVRINSLLKQKEPFYYSDESHNNTQLYNFFGLTHIPVPTEAALTEMEQIEEVWWKFFILFFNSVKEVENNAIYSSQTEASPRNGDSKPRKFPHRLGGLDF
jgi:hypothetical protein